MTRPGRNQRCSCGSGRKYKNCCLLRPIEVVYPSDKKRYASETAVGWLMEHHRPAVHNALRADYFGLLNEEGRANLVDISDNVEEAIHSNAKEWLLAQAQLTLRDGRKVRASELVLGRGGPLLTRDHRSYLKTLAASPFALFEVRDSRANDGILLKHLLAEWVRDTWMPNSKYPGLLPGDVVGTRTIFMDGWHLAGAYLFKPRLGAIVRDAIFRLLRDPYLAGSKWYSPRANDLLSRVVIGCWLRAVTTPPRAVQRASPR